MTTFEKLLAQAKVELDPKGLYLGKEHRTCEATARLLVAVRALIDAHADDMVRSAEERTKVSRENSRLATRVAELERELSQLKQIAIARGLEGLTELSQAQRERLMSFDSSAA